MTAIADQSTMTAWPAWVWALGVVVLALGLLIVGLCRAAAKPAPQPERQVEASAYGPACRPTVKPRCAVPFCDDEATVHKRIGYETWTFCLEHGLPYLGNEVA